MAQVSVSAAFVRRYQQGAVLRSAALPEAIEERNSFLLAALGSPDGCGRQLDGMGGELSWLSKAVIVEPSVRPGFDVESLRSNLGRQTDRRLRHQLRQPASAVGPYAVHQVW